MRKYHVRFFVLFGVLALTVACMVPAIAQAGTYGKGNPKHPVSASSWPKGAAGQETGRTSNGLRMSLSLVGADKVDRPSFRVMFENVSEKDVTLNLGTMLANGKVQFPDSVHLALTDATGKRRELHFSDKRYPGVSGRVDDYVLPLRAGSSYTILLRLDQFWSPSTKEIDVKLMPGKYQVLAQFTGSGANTHNSDSTGIALMNFWDGRLESNTLTLDFPGIHGIQEVKRL